MTDVCIIYSRHDAHVPSQLESVLAPRWNVWWDEKINGDYRRAIEDAIPTAACVIPVWSSSSRVSRFVLDEAELALRHQVPLLPILVEKGVHPPMGFGSFDTIDLSDWRGESDHPSLQKLIRKLLAIAPAKALPSQRPKGLLIGEKSIRYPALFYSVSSHETQLKPEDAVQALSLFGADSILVSAYDLIGRDAKRRLRILEQCHAAGAAVLLDSGNYEASRKGDKSWNASKLHRVLASAPHDWAFCFDKINPRNDPEFLVRNVLDAVERDAKHTSKPVLPIVHAPRLSTGEYDLTHIPSVIRRVANELKPALVAIPERELGAGIIQRAKSVHRIREELNELGFYQPLHILGTGNPLSIAILSAVGGDSFDGLEWCRVVADADKGTLYHFQHYDFFAYQTAVANSVVARDASVSSEITYAGKVVFHNLDFFSQFMDELRNATVDRRLVRFLSVRLPVGSMEQLEQALPKVF